MSNARARANHSLYLARILISAWREAEQQQELPQRVVAQAYLPAAQGHLVQAYGWFLLEVSGIEDLPESPPTCCDELPATAAGKAIPAEIREFRQLEQQGWLAELLAASAPVTAARAMPGNLAIAVGSDLDAAQFQAWSDAMASIFDRMGDSLDEF